MTLGAGPRHIFARHLTHWRSQGVTDRYLRWHPRPVVSTSSGNLPPAPASGQPSGRRSTPGAGDGPSTRALPRAASAAAGRRSSNGCSASCPGICSLGEVVHLWQRGVLRRRALRLRRALLRAARSGPRSAVARSAAGTAALATRMEELRARVERTRHIPRLIAPRLMGRAARRPPRVRRARSCGSTARSARPPAAPSSSTPQARALAYCLRTEPGIDLRVVHVVRDSRGVAYSWTKKVPRPEADGDEALMTRYSPRGPRRCCGTPQRCLRPARPPGHPDAPAALRGVPGRPARRC